MMELFNAIEWNDYVEIFSSGNPPLYVQLLIFVGLSFAWFMYRVIARKRPMSTGNKIKYKTGFFVVIGLILFQEKFEVRSWMETIGF